MRKSASSDEKSPPGPVGKSELHLVLRLVTPGPRQDIVREGGTQLDGLAQPATDTPVLDVDETQTDIGDGDDSGRPGLGLRLPGDQELPGQAVPPAEGRLLVLLALAPQRRPLDGNAPLPGRHVGGEHAKSREKKRAQPSPSFSRPTSTLGRRESGALLLPPTD
ncbi:hypothetical protein ACH4FX_02415 [Streptomyces sp. NPDC018019]|uniref:hypothetical protein n=1 Tax=Streptomyces sp. NPDC018019 TaxID=3365030 RepID=UPI00378DCE28